MEKKSYDELHERLETVESGHAYLLASYAEVKEQLECINKNTRDLVDMFQGAQSAGRFLAKFCRLFVKLSKVLVAIGAAWAAIHAATGGSWSDFLKK
jgi:hypothetical protein